MQFWRGHYERNPDTLAMPSTYSLRSRQDALDALRGDGVPCNERYGWYGTKPGCKRKSKVGGKRSWMTVLTRDEAREYREMTDINDMLAFDLATAQEMQRSATAKLNAGRGSSRSIAAKNVMARSGLTGYTAADLNAALDSIPDAAPRIKQLRQFVNDQGVRVIFNDRDADSPATKKLAKKTGLSPGDIAANGSLGHTKMTANHVQIAPGGPLTFDRAAHNRAMGTIAKTAKSPVNRKTFSGGNDDDPLYTALHEVGHQVDFSSRLVDRRSGRYIDPQTQSPTRYGATNRDETFAEAFALYMIHGDKYSTAHPATAAWVKEKLDWVTKK